jgi:hypothetical protein
MGQAIGDLIQRRQRGRVKFSRPFECAPPGGNLEAWRGWIEMERGECEREHLSRPILVFSFKYILKRYFVV